MIIQNFDSLNTSKEREIVLKLIEAGLQAIQPQNVISQNFSLEDNLLKVCNHVIDLSNFEKIYLVGFGKGSAELSKLVGNILKDKITHGYVIDVNPDEYPHIEFTQGTHPLPSQTNIDFTKKVISLADTLTKNDLVLVLTCGGGSSLFEVPAKITLEKELEIYSALIKSGTDIYETNTLRKHLSLVKGGGLAKLLYPAQIINLIFSDVPGNDLSVIASAPLVKDHTTKEDALEIITKYNINEHVNISDDDLIETPKEDEYFTNISNILVLSNLTALQAMESEAAKLGYNAFIYSDKLKGDYRLNAQTLLDLAQDGKILLAGGESSIKVTGTGQGGRNQSLVLSVLDLLDNETVIASFDSDGWDYTTLAGAIADKSTYKKVLENNQDIQKILDNNDTLPLFQLTGDGIVTGKLPSNVSDLMIVLKK